MTINDVQAGTEACYNMIKSVIIKDNGRLLLKIKALKNGEYEIIKDSNLQYLTIDVRNEKNEKVLFS